jgi:hypothetical protein
MDRNIVRQDACKIKRSGTLRLTGTYDDKSHSTTVDKRTNFKDNPFINETYDPINDIYTYEVNVPHKNKIIDVRSAQNNMGVIGTPSQEKGVYTFTTLNRVESATFYSHRPYDHHYFNMQNFNTHYSGRPHQQPKHLNLFGYTWFR